MPQAPLAPGLFTWPDDQPRLIGSRCAACDATTFPVQENCPRCGSSDMAQRLLPRRGTLVSWTTQEFFPRDLYANGETEETFTPFGVGLVQLDGEVRIEARLTLSDPSQLQFGMDVELVVVPFRVEADGTETVMFAFAPA